MLKVITFRECSIVTPPSQLRSVESVATRLKTETMGKSSWRATCARSLFANRAMSMSVATVTNAALSAALPTNATKVRSRLNPVLARS